MTAIIYAFLVLTALGLILGIGLNIADKKLAVQKDEKLEALEGIMPGANCGGCGFAGCSAYAQAVYEGSAKPGLCSPGGQNLADKMGEILNIKVDKVEKLTAFVFCSGNSEATSRKFDYKGLDDCNAAAMLFNGDLSCKSGCLALGSCIKVCNENAIYRDADGTIKVNRALCSGCGKCTKVCHNNVIKLIPFTQDCVVACNSNESGAVVRKICKNGCIGCKICENKFPASGLKVDNCLAFKDNCPSNEETNLAIQACPVKVIRKI